MTPRFLLIARRRLTVALVLAIAALAVAGTLRAEDDAGPETDADLAGMTLARLDALIMAVDEDAARHPSGRNWRLTVEGVAAMVVTDPGHDRMRIIVGVAEGGEVDRATLQRLMQANFDTALDARYAIAQDVLWATFIHPLGPLTDDQFLSGLGQTVNLARTFGTTFSSGVLSFRGGDSPGIIERELIDRLRALRDEVPT